MSELLTNIGAIFSNLLNWLGNVASSLITNPIFIIIMAIIMVAYLYDIILDLKINIAHSNRLDWGQEIRNTKRHEGNFSERLQDKLLNK